MTAPFWEGTDWSTFTAPTDGQTYVVLGLGSSANVPAAMKLVMDALSMIGQKLTLAQEEQLAMDVAGLLGTSAVQFALVLPQLYTAVASKSYIQALVIVLGLISN